MKAVDAAMWVGAFGILGYSYQKMQTSRRKARCIKSQCVRDKVDQGMSADQAIEECCD